MYKAFVRTLLVVSAAMIVLFAGEFFFEYYRLGLPAEALVGWGNVNNTKLVDLLSPIARAYNNILAMLLATIGLAIPLTANMHTPKLIDICCIVLAMVLALLACSSVRSVYTSVFMLVYCSEVKNPKTNACATMSHTGVPAPMVANRAMSRPRIMVLAIKTPR
jgi:hypothetical protein